MMECVRPDEDLGVTYIIENCMNMVVMDPKKGSPDNDYHLEKSNDRKKNKRHGARNQHRHKIFVKWLLETFDLLRHSLNSDENVEQQSRPCHVLDVAGGKGEVAARLVMCHRLHVIMVDPRPANVAHCFETLVLPKIPNKWQKRLEQQRAENSNFVQETVESRFRQLVTTFEYYNNNNSCILKTTNAAASCTNEELQDAIRGAAVLVGLHADGATEAIVDAAIHYGKPFVVVPCCVFPNLFTSRKILDAKGNLVQVSSHEQFCQYLQKKDSRFKREVLPFEGRNVAIWWDGK